MNKIRVPVAYRVAGSMTVVVFLVALFMLLFFPDRQIRNDLQSQARTAEILTQMTSYQVAFGLDFEDLTTIRQAMKGLDKDETFVFTVLFDDSGKELARHNSGPLTKLTQQHRGGSLDTWIGGIDPKSQSAVLESKKPSHENREWGLLALAPVSTASGKQAVLATGFSRHLIEEHNASTKQTSLIVAICMMLVGIAAAFLVGIPLGNRVGRVEQVARRIAKGDLSVDAISDTSNDEIGDMVASFNIMTENLRQLGRVVAQVAAGDLTGNVEISGDLANSVRQMVTNQREMVSQIAATATQLNAAAAQFLANARLQERGASDQSTAVEEIRRTLATLLMSAREVGNAAGDVLQNAERSQQNSQVVSERIALLSSQSQRIGEILEIIKDIANKSDLLALNAALEGTKAGTAGRGFSLVATQMQRLAENVMGSVRDIKELTVSISEATQATVLATEESTKLSGDTTRSARQISLIIQQQQSGTEQATQAMDDVAEIAGQTAAGGKEIVHSATDLASLSERLQSLVGRFVLESEEGSLSDAGHFADAQKGGVASDVS